MRKKDQSTKFIKTCLADALIKLMEQGNGFEEINVGEICDLAGFGRSTYYRHFDKKSGKSNLILFRVYCKWEEYCRCREQEIEKSRMRALINFFYEERELFLLLDRNGLTRSIIFDILYLAICSVEGESKDMSYWRSFMACGIFGFIYNWIRSGFTDSPEYVYKLASKVFPN